MLEHLHLVRHGEVDNPRHVCYADLPGFSLTDAGRLQATAAGHRLADVAPKATVVTSPLERAVETATIIAGVLGVPIALDDRLVEWGLARRWAGVVWEDIPALFPGELEAYLDHPHDLAFSPEPISEVARRFAEAVEAICGATDGGAAVVVSHQDPLQAARLALTGRPLGDLGHDKPVHAEIVSLVPRGGIWAETERWAPAIGGNGFAPPSPRRPQP